MSLSIYVLFISLKSLFHTTVYTLYYYNKFEWIMSTVGGQYFVIKGYNDYYFVNC